METADLWEGAFETCLPLGAWLDRAHDCMNHPFSCLNSILLIFYYQWSTSEKTKIKTIQQTHQRKIPRIFQFVTNVLNHHLALVGTLNDSSGSSHVRTDAQTKM